MEPFSINVQAVENLVSSGINKTPDGALGNATIGEPMDVYTLNMSNEELLSLDKSWKAKYAPYEGKINKRQNRNKQFYLGMPENSNEIPTSSNVLFEAEETFIPQALAQNPEPVVWSDNTDEGKRASNEIKTMLQYHADTLALKKKLGVALRHWSIYFIGIVKHGWDKKGNDITLEVRNPKNFVFDPDGYIDSKGVYKGAFLGEKIKITADKLIELFPSSKEQINEKVGGKLGTQCEYIEWWTDDYCFSIFEDIILDKHKNEFFNYGTEEEGLDENGEVIKVKKEGFNHISHPQMPYNFFSVFSLEEAPHDSTNLIEQNISNQMIISERDVQISKNIRVNNNSLIVDPNHFNEETAKQAAIAIEDGSPILGNPEGIKRLPAVALPNGLIESQSIAKDTLRSTFGVQGLSAQKQTSETTARGMILNQAHDATRIGGGIGDALEQLADSIFNFQVQMYYVFYNETHFAAIMGNGAAVDYVQLNMSNPDRHFVVSVQPDSMTPKDEITEQNQAIELANAGWLDPINLFKKLNDPDPLNTAKMVTMWRVSPQLYMQTFFPESQPVIPPMGNPNPPDVQPEQGQTDTTLGAPPASASLSQVPINSQSLPK